MIIYHRECVWSVEGGGHWLHNWTPLEKDLASLSVIVTYFYIRKNVKTEWQSRTTSIQQSSDSRKTRETRELAEAKNQKQTLEMIKS